MRSNSNNTHIDGTSFRDSDKNSSSSGDKVQEYTALYNRLKQNLQTSLPVVDDFLRACFVSSCDSVLSAQTTLDKATKVRNEAKDDRQKKDADAVVDSAQSALDEANKVNISAALPVLDAIGVLADDGVAIVTTSLMQCFILKTGTPENLAKFANQGPDQAVLIDRLLTNEVLLRQIICAGCARKDNFGPAMQIYHDICKHTDKIPKEALLQRFALATALEHAEKRAEFDTPNTFTDPIKRYLCYERAYLNGELDPAFPNLTTWEYRMICDCDAPDEQLLWGRDMLRNYRPDEVFEDYAWRYCRSVRTEVGYRRPEWTEKPRTYQQLISGGGQCGPRAWFGRFICKSFGIPTWGARQPGK